MVKATNLIKKLLPIGLVIGGLIFLSQSKKVNIFKTTVPPEINIQPTKNVPFFFSQTIPQFVPIPFQETKESITERFGPLYTKSEFQRETPQSIRDFNIIGTRGNWGPNTLKQARANFKRTFETITSYTPFYEDEDE
jgi:hypothetical protein